MEEWKIDAALIHLRIARYLLLEADRRGMTHGEKHHYLFVAISELGNAQSELNDPGHSVLTHNDYQEIKVADIPF